MRPLKVLHLVSVLCISNLPGWLYAESLVDHFAVASGGGEITSGSYIVLYTIGEPISGTANSARFSLRSGYWGSPGPWIGGGNPPTHTVLASLTAHRLGQDVLLQWCTTGIPADALLVVWRQVEAGERCKLEGIAEDLGTGRYSFRDADAPFEGLMYWLQLCSSTEPSWLGSVHVDAVPLAFQLLPACPNPFNPKTRLTFSITRAQPVALRIYNARGFLVRTLIHEVMRPGQHACSWDGTNDSGGLVASGVYIGVLECREGNRAQKLVLLR